MTTCSREMRNAAAIFDPYQEKRLAVLEQRRSGIKDSISSVRPMTGGQNRISLVAMKQFHCLVLRRHSFSRLTVAKTAKYSPLAFAYSRHSHSARSRTAVINPAPFLPWKKATTALASNKSLIPHPDSCLALVDPNRRHMRRCWRHTMMRRDDFGLRAIPPPLEPIVHIGRHG